MVSSKPSVSSTAATHERTKDKHLVVRSKNHMPGTSARRSPSPDKRLNERMSERMSCVGRSLRSTIRNHETLKFKSRATTSEQRRTNEAASEPSALDQHRVKRAPRAKGPRACPYRVNHRPLTTHGLQSVDAKWNLRQTERALIHLQQSTPRHTTLCCDVVLVSGSARPLYP